MPLWAIWEVDLTGADGEPYIPALDTLSTDLLDGGWQGCRLGVIAEFQRAKELLPTLYDKPLDIWLPGPAPQLDELLRELSHKRNWAYYHHLLAKYGVDAAAAKTAMDDTIDATISYRTGCGKGAVKAMRRSCTAPQGCMLS